MTMKPPPPNKQPPPPPPPPPRPKTQSQPPSNYSVNSNLSGILSSKSNGSNALPNNGSSINSLNSGSGRFSHAPSHGNTSFAMPSSHRAQGCFPRHGDTFNSRSSLTSHKSLQHYHHSSGYGCNGNSACRTSHCLHQTCACSKTQHNHANSSSMSDNGSFNQDNRHYMHPQFGVNCECNSSIICHPHSHAPNCQPQNAGSQTTKGPIIGHTDGRGSTLPIAPFCNGEGSDVDHMSNGCLSDSGIHGHCSGVFTHHLEHDHHHHHHQPSIASNSSIDPSSAHVNGCASQASSVNTSTIEPASRTIAANHCAHTHRTNICGHHHHHHHQSNCCDHHTPLVVAEQTCSCDNCIHIHNGHLLHHSCNSAILGTGNKGCASSSGSHHYSPELVANQISGATHIDPSMSTVHTHNLSNSSTTTHTSNVAVRQQPQYYRPISFKECGGRSDSSQQYEHYGLSSGASTSSANASLSCYQANGGYEVVPSCHLPSKTNQPLPPPPPPPPPTSKYRPVPPAPVLNDRKPSSTNGSRHPSFPGMHSNEGISTNKDLYNPPTDYNGGFYQQQSYQPNQQQYNQTSPPPPPPKSISPASTIGKRPTLMHQDALTTSNQPVAIHNQTANNSQAPPPQPPALNSRPQLSTLRDSPRNHPINSTQQDINPIPDFINLNLRNRNGVMTAAESKLEELTRQVELKMEKQQRSGEPHGICPKCGDKVMPTQEACKAMNQIYHVSCFICCECGRTLSNKTFYPVGDKVYCEEDFKYTGHLKSLEKCAACSQPILDMILPAMGKSYHPKCFKCSVCGQCLDGVPFTIDGENKIYCVKDYHRLLN